MEDIFVLVLLCAAMFIGCYVAGSIPLIMQITETKLQLMSVLGAGLLVGTALAVIVPEGISTLLSHSEGKKSEEHLIEPHALIGVALVLGFVFMLLVERISSPSVQAIINNSGQKFDQDKTYVEGGSKNNNITATLGLVVHAAADGVALGAAAATNHTDVEIIVFLAIMLHKAPAAFGLVTFLLHENFDRTRIRRHLLVFSVAAPLLALITFGAVTQRGSGTLLSEQAPGLALLFSAGTFLFVATVHVLPEVASRSNDHKGFTRVEFLSLVTGILLPLFLALMHHHH